MSAPYRVIWGWSRYEDFEDANAAGHRVREMDAEREAAKADPRYQAPDIHVLTANAYYAPLEGDGERA